MMGAGTPPAQGEVAAAPRATLEECGTPRGQQGPPSAWSLPGLGLSPVSSPVWCLSGPGSDSHQRGLLSNLQAVPGPPSWLSGRSLPGAEWHQRWPALCCHPVPAPWRSDWAPWLGHGWLHCTWLHRCLPTFIHSFVHSAAAYSVLGSGLRTRLREFIHGQKKQASEPACHRDKTCVSQRQSAGSREKGS